jgi:DNA recombination-dependent growth factor C
MSSGFIYRPKKRVLTEEERIATLVKARIDSLEVEGGTATFEMRKTATHFQYKVNDGSWVSLIALSELKGSNGSDATVTKAAVEAVLTGEISTHTHAGGGLTQSQILTRQL